MEIGSGSEDKSPPEDGARPPSSSAEGPEMKQPKRKMKSPYQLEVLEKTYAMETYPSEALRAELSVKLGLTDRQLQMWFCHRRLKDRKLPSARRPKVEEDVSPPPLSLPVHMSGSETPTGSLSATVSGHLGGETRKGAGRSGVHRIGADMWAPAAVGRRYYDAMPAMYAPPSIAPQLSMAEMRLIQSVEQQLGEPLREDGPVLGVEFDPLPPGAFGAPIVTSQPKQPVRSYESKLFHEAKSIKASTLLPSVEHSVIPTSSTGKRKQPGGGVHSVHSHVSSRTLHEYQFLPEQPSIRSEVYEKAPQSHYYESSLGVVPLSKVPLTSGDQILHDKEHITPSYGFQSPVSSSSMLSQRGRQRMLSGSADYEGGLHNNSYTDTANDAPYGMHQVIEMENPVLQSDKMMIGEEDASRMEKRRKTEEARIQKEVEAHEKRIRKELEKQDMLRRKREEQMRKELERLDREKRKEEERLMREKQREEERYQREQRREIERQEKFLIKESLRVEKMKQKEELRKEKEAARLKAASERATARRLAKEYMELVEDERLELMELAAAKKGLSSTITLDSETLEQLDSFRCMLSAFPPKSVQLKKPFAILPWSDSEENVGNLLMVWRFLITFADILELWPFTLDEFVQALHDYDSRLLGEVHVALLKSIIKDIEDVGRTPANTWGPNPHGGGGGHLRIVEGAYAWGFNIGTWQSHLNSLSWSEVLRQFALSAGFGPKLKKRNVRRAYHPDDNEGNDGEDVISNIRSGLAAENAVSLMQERGYTHRRRSRHRLTPGTVKFAAFHVLSLEGSKGLTILEVASRIQKSGLRDLTTSKTPEASIAAALSRDTRLFERTAPSTYCVRSPYRRDPADADALLAAAREKIQIFQNTLSDSEEAEKDTEYAEDVDEPDRDDDSEGEEPCDPELDDVGVHAKGGTDLPSVDLKHPTTSTSFISGKGKQLPNDILASPIMENDFHVTPLGNSKTIDISDRNDETLHADTTHELNDIEQEDTEIDESNPGESWVQGLAEGEYSDLSVEERLNALVALITVAMEGNLIRTTLEERLEAASCLKKQMWSEAQMDKRRLKEEYVSKAQYPSYTGMKVEPSHLSAAAEDNQTPIYSNNKGNYVNTITMMDDQVLNPNDLNNINTVSEKNLSEQDFSFNPDCISAQSYGFAIEKSRAQLKSFIGHKAEETYVYRSLPLGQDRRRNRYWQFSTSASPNDPGSGRIFFESKDGQWRLIDSEEAFNALLSSLDTRGIRESYLHSMLQKIEPTFKEAIRRNKTSVDSASASQGNIKVVGGSSSPGVNKEFDSPSSTVCDINSDALESSSSFKIECGQTELQRSSAVMRYQNFCKWMWTECFNPSALSALKYGKKRSVELFQTCQTCYLSYFNEERHCPSCHRTFKVFHDNDTIFMDHVVLCEEKRKRDPDWKIHVPDFTLPIRNRLLKAQLSLIEVSVPAEALLPFWTETYRKSWGTKLHSSSSSEDLFKVLTILEGAIRQACLSSSFETTNEILSSSTSTYTGDSTVALSGSVPVLPWVPYTTAAVALRLLDLDASISYVLHQKPESQKERETGGFMKHPSRYTVVKNMEELALIETQERIGYPIDERWLDSGSGRRGRGRGTRGRGGRGRGRGRRGQRGLTAMRPDLLEGGVAGGIARARKDTRRGRTRGRGRKRGRRSFRPRQVSESGGPIREKQVSSFAFVNDDNSKHIVAEESPRSYDEDDWGLGESRTDYVEDENVESSESDDQGQASGEEYDDQDGNEVDYDRSRRLRLMDEESEEDEEGEEDGEDDLRYHRVAREELEVEDDEDEEMGEEEGDEDAGEDIANGVDEDGGISQSSDYSED